MIEKEGIIILAIFYGFLLPVWFAWGLGDLSSRIEEIEKKLDIKR